MRGFYRVETPALLWGGVVLAVIGPYAYIHVPIDSTMPESAERLGGTWREFKAKLTPAQRRKIFRKLVRRTVTEDGKRVFRVVWVKMQDTEASDVTLAEWIPPHKFLGDPEPEPVP